MRGTLRLCVGAALFLVFAVLGAGMAVADTPTLT
jgi:hypothetical protein